MRVLISGASIAGPVLAFWLKRYGFEPTVVEKAPARRKTGGHSVDQRVQTAVRKMFAAEAQRLGVRTMSGAVFDELVQ